MTFRYRGSIVVTSVTKTSGRLSTILHVAIGCSDRSEPRIKSQRVQERGGGEVKRGPLPPTPQMFPQVQANGANLGRRATKTTGSSECSPHFDPELLPGGEHAIIWTLQQLAPSSGATATLTAAVLHRPAKTDCGRSPLRTLFLMTGAEEAASSLSTQIKPLPPEPGRK